MDGPSRRSVLALAGTWLAGLAGCSSRKTPTGTTVPRSRTREATTEPSTPEPTPEPTDSPTEEPTEKSAPDHEALRWWFDTGGTDVLAPTVRDGTVYVGGSRERIYTQTPTDLPYELYALDLADGQERWTFETRTPVESSPTVHGDTVYVVSGIDHGMGADDYKLDAVDAASGSHRWRFGFDNSKHLNLLAVSDDFAFVGMNDDEMESDDEFTYALDSKTGEKRWRVEYGDTFEGLATDGTLYVAAPHYVLYALDATTGDERWRYEASSFHAPVVHDGAVLVESDGIASLHPKTGEVNWRFELENDFVDARITTPNGVVAGTDDGNVIAIDATDGTERWRYEQIGDINGVHRSGDSIIVGTSRSVVALDDGNGETVWQYRNSDIYNVREAGPDSVFVTMGEETGLLALDAADGTERWRFAPGGKLSKPVSADETVLVGSTDGRLYALEV